MINRLVLENDRRLLTLFSLHLGMLRIMQGNEDKCSSAVGVLL